MLRKQQPSFTDKIIPVPGDLCAKGLGLASEDAERVRQNVSVVIHCAATVSFNERLDQSLQINVVSVQTVWPLFRYSNDFVNQKRPFFAHNPPSY